MSIGVRKTILGAAATVVVLGAVLVGYWFLCVALNGVLRVEPVLDTAISLILAATAIVAGLFWLTWAYSYLVFVGKGLPLEAFGMALHPTRVLVTTGPYAYSRHPMALGLMFILLGIALLARSAPGLILVPIIALVFHLYLVEFEEKALVRRFGGSYEHYRRTVPAIVPRLTPYVAEAPHKA